MIVIVGGEKGGVGKTTIATHLAVARKAAGRSVLLVDADPQGTATTWMDMRKDKNVQQVPIISMKGQKVHIDLREQAKHYQDLVVDTGGADSHEFRSALLAADTVVLPLRPGSFDFWTLQKMAGVIVTPAGVSPSAMAFIASRAEATSSAGFWSITTSIRSS